MDVVDALERVIRRDRALMAAGLAAMTVLAWTWLARSAAGKCLPAALQVATRVPAAALA